MRELAKVFKALSDETRLRILNLLMERECCVCEVMQALDISQTRASRNLSILYNSGFLKARRNGMWVLYSIDEDNINKENQNLLDGIRSQLKNNNLAKEDLKRLLSAKRIGVECCSTRSANFASPN